MKIGCVGKIQTKPTVSSEHTETFGQDDDVVQPRGERLLSSL